MTNRTNGNDQNKQIQMEGNDFPASTGNNQVIIPDSILKDAESMMDFLLFMDKDHATYEEMSIVKSLLPRSETLSYQEMLPILEDQIRWIVSMKNNDQISSIEDGQGFVDDYVKSKK